MVILVNPGAEEIRPGCSQCFPFFGGICSPCFVLGTFGVEFFGLPSAPISLPSGLIDRVRRCHRPSDSPAAESPESSRGPADRQLPQQPEPREREPKPGAGKVL